MILVHLRRYCLLYQNVRRVPYGFYAIYFNFLDIITYCFWKRPVDVVSILQKKSVIT